ncbi:hypothetical protein D3C87_1304900 [compost metagenome]
MAKSRGRDLGPGIGMSSSLAIAYERKIQEFVNKSGGIISEVQLKQMIREKIIATQNLEHTAEAVKESAQRKDQRTVLKLNRMDFSFHKRIEHPEFATVHVGYFAEYIPEAKSFFWLAPNKDRNGNSILGFSLMRFNLEKDVVTTERDDITAMTLLKGPAQALIMTRGGSTEIVDLTTMVVDHEIVTKLPDDRVLNFATDIKNKAAVVAVNESETVLAVSESWKVHFFDTRSGSYLGAFEDHTGFNSYVRDIHFISDREVVFNKAGSLVKMDVVTLDKQVVEVFKGVTVTGLEVSLDKKTISMMDLNSVVTIRTSDLKIENTEIIFSASGGSQTRMLKRVVGSSNELIHIGGRDASRVGIYNQSVMTIPSFDFGKYPIQSFQGNDVLAISIPMDRSHAIVVGTDKKKPFLDIWNYAE